MLSRDQVVGAFDRLRVWSSHDVRAPHKPLLVLYCLGRIAAGEPNDFRFRDVKPILENLLIEFGPSRAVYKPEQPFWRLKSDGIWILENADMLAAQADVTKGDLLRNHVRGHFVVEIATMLQQNPDLINIIANRLLDAHFPPSLHEDILAAVGLDTHMVDSIARRKRDPAFRARILIAYEWSCVVCGFDVRLAGQSIALEAAHIKWHQAGGPDEEVNGLALCSMHHKAFDLGAFTIRGDRVLLVSEKAHGTSGFNEGLMRFHGRPIRAAQRPDYAPAEAFLGWHASQVFKKPARCT